MRILALAIGMVLLSGSALSRDGWDRDRPTVCGLASRPEICQNWISTVQRPDYRGASCCGAADSFLADNFVLGPNGELYAVISEDYPDVPGIDLDDGSAPHDFSIHKGDRILIPPEKVNHLPEDANRSSHGVVFLMPSNHSVLCYFFPPLT